MICRSLVKSVKRQLKEMSTIGLLNQKMMNQIEEINFNIGDISKLEENKLFDLAADKALDDEEAAKKELNSTAKAKSLINARDIMDVKIQTTKIHALESELLLMKKRLGLYVNLLAAGKFNVGVILDSNFTLLENFLEEYNVIMRNSESLYNKMLQFEQELNLEKSLPKKSKFMSTMKKIKTDFYGIKNGLEIVTKFVLVVGKFKEFSKISLIAREDLENENLVRDLLNSKSFKSMNVVPVKNPIRLNWKYIADNKTKPIEIYSQRPKSFKQNAIKGFENLEKFIKNDFKSSLKNSLLSKDTLKTQADVDKIFYGIQKTWNTTSVETFSVMARNYMIKKSLNFDCGFKLLENVKKEFEFFSEDIENEKNEPVNNSKAIQFLMSFISHTLDEIVIIFI